MTLESRSESQLFRIALRSGDLSGIRRAPKSDLHNHSIFGTRLERVELWRQKSLQRAQTRMSSLDEMMKYAQEVLYPHTNFLAGFQFTARSAIEDAIMDGVTTFEMSLDVRFISLFENGPDDFFSFVTDLVQTHRDRVDFRPEIGMSKDRPAADQIRLASLCIESGIFRSVDLYGNETAQPPDPYREIYDKARRRGLKSMSAVTSVCAMPRKRWYSAM
jgi:adenosine deaminase